MALNDIGKKNGELAGLLPIVYSNSKNIVYISAVKKSTDFNW